MQTNFVSYSSSIGRLELQEFPYMKSKYFWGSGLWSPVVYFDSIGQNPEDISAYVRSQGQ